MKLLLLPNLLGNIKHHQIFLPASVDRAMEQIDGLIAESEGGGRSFLKRFQLKDKPHNIPLQLLNKHTKHDEIDFMLEPILKGEIWGLISDAGLPCLADPGAALVARARKVGIPIQAFIGPSSISMSLMLSGFSGQQFTFHGYPPYQGLGAYIKEMEKNALEYTQIFIQAPHRNQETLEALMNTLCDKTRLCVAWNLTLQDQGVVSEEVGIWKKSPLPNLHKKPAIYLISR